MKTFLLSLAASLLLVSAAEAAPLAAAPPKHGHWDKKHDDKKRKDDKRRGPDNYHAHGNQQWNNGRGPDKRCDNDRRDGRYSRNDRNPRDRQGYGYNDRQVSASDQARWDKFRRNK